MRNLKITLLFIAFIIISSIAIERSGTVFKGPVFKGEGENWNGEMVTSYNLKGEEIQSIKVSYIGKNPEQLKEIDVAIESSDFYGWGIPEIELDEHGNFNSGEAFKLDSKTPPTSKILLKIDGEKTETMTLTWNP